MSSGGIIAIIVISALLGILFWAGIIYLIIKVLGKGKELADSSIAKNRAYAESLNKTNQWKTFRDKNHRQNVMAWFNKKLAQTLEPFKEQFEQKKRQWMTKKMSQGVVGTTLNTVKGGIGGVLATAGLIAGYQTSKKVLGKKQAKSLRNQTLFKNPAKKVVVKPFSKAKQNIVSSYQKGHSKHQTLHKSDEFAKLKQQKQNLKKIKKQSKKEK